MEKNLSDKIILITGGTSRLGSAFVRRALGGGARVLFTYHTHTAAAKTLMGEGAEGFPLDLADMRAIDRFAKTVKEKMPALDVLIHNAALVRDHTIQNMSEQEWDEVLTVNLKAPYYLTKKLLPLLLKARKSVIGNPAMAANDGVAKIFMITSRVALSGGFGVSNYAAAKAGLIGLARSLAAELGKKQILVNAVNPGFMKSRMTENLPPEVVERNLAASPLGRLSEPDEVAEFLAFLCSDRMTQVTGQVFNYDSRKMS